MDIQIKKMKQVNAELNLIDTPDWGITNGTADRLKEFINYYNNNVEVLDDQTKYNYLELVISSMNDAILERKVDGEIEYMFQEYIEPYLDDSKITSSNELNFLCYDTILYWISIANKEEFPVGLLLKR